MSRSDGPDADHQRAIDQLVDEICQRLATLRSLVNTPRLEPGRSLQAIRRDAGDLVERLAGPDPRDTAHLVAGALFPAEPDEEIPLWWRATPLGVLISAALDGHHADAFGSLIIPVTIRRVGEQPGEVRCHELR